LAWSSRQHCTLRSNSEDLLASKLVEERGKDGFGETYVFDYRNLAS